MHSTRLHNRDPPTAQTITNIIAGWSADYLLTFGRRITQALIQLMKGWWSMAG